MPLTITILDDYASIVSTLPCLSLIGEHHLSIYTDCERDIDQLANRLQIGRAHV